MTALSKQLISRLSDSLPAGLFQIDLRRHLTFTNDRLHVIIQTPAAATTEAQFAAVHPDDRDRLETALTAVLADKLVDDLELRFQLPTVDGDERGTRVCLLSLRSLTDSTDVVTGAIGCVSDVTDSVRLRRELQIRANVDALTGCLNRSATLEPSRARRSRTLDERRRARRHLRRPRWLQERQRRVRARHRRRDPYRRVPANAGRASLRGPRRSTRRR